MDPSSDLNRIYPLKTIKIKKNTIQNPDEPPKPKRKYTRKAMPQNIDITIDTAVAPKVEEPKPKRKYTRRN